jgi:molybdopterin molybdotransferase
MKEFFKVACIEEVLALKNEFPIVAKETIPINDAFGRILAEDLISRQDIPDFSKSTMDGFAVLASSTFGASDGNPALLRLAGSVSMGKAPDFSIQPGEAGRILTGGMLPSGADSVVMSEHTEVLDENTIEVYRSVAPLSNVIERGEEFSRGDLVMTRGIRLRAQELALLAAMGEQEVAVFKHPVVGIISTGDEVVPVNAEIEPGQVRDMNTFALIGLCKQAGAVPVSFGIVPDRRDALLLVCTRALEGCDMVVVSGGSSIGSRDYTIDVLTALHDSRIFIHGVAISPGKPTILAKAQGKAVWGLPGHVVSAMVVFDALILPFIEHIAGCAAHKKPTIPARLTRNIASVQGRVDFVRVQLEEKDGELWADPVLGKSGVIRTMVKADGLIRIDLNEEGLDQGIVVGVFPFF